jgi:hypothetical protein
MPSSDNAQTTRQLLVFCDGTNNTLTGGRQDTNVLRLVEHICSSALAAQPAPTVYYDPGVGSASNMPSIGGGEAILRKLNRIKGLALGTGVYENIEQALIFIAQHHQGDDQVFLFGFSRGAFTSRAVSGIINLFGLPAAHMVHLLPVMIQHYFLEPDRRNKAVTDQLQQIAQCRLIDIQFVGVWDTVESVGLPLIGRKISNTSSLAGKCFVHVRQALALDEYRFTFKPRLYDEAGGTFVTKSGAAGTLLQVWFPGSHCDVGGGNERTNGQPDRSDEAYAWMLNEAIHCGLRSLPVVTPVIDPAAQPALVHSELYSTPWWALAGMQVRAEVGFAAIGGGGGGTTAAQVNPPLNFPQDTQWASHRSLQPMGVAILLAAMGWLLMDYCLAPTTDTFWNYLAKLSLDTVFQVPAFVHWQWTGWMHPATAWHTSSGASPLWALAWDTLLFIPSIGYLIARVSSAAFATAAGLQVHGNPVRSMLQWLGMAPLAWLLADLAENALTALLLVMHSSGNVWSIVLLGIACLMSLAATLKYAALAGVVALWVLSWTTPRQGAALAK